MTPSQYILNAGNWYFPTPNRSTVPGPNGIILTGGTVLNLVTDAGQIAALVAALATNDPIPAGAKIVQQGVNGAISATTDTTPIYSVPRGSVYTNYTDANGKSGSVRKQL